MDKSFLSKLYESGLGAKYDECCKSILAEKIILAWIMNACVEEYKGIDPNEIAEKYIEGEPEIGSVGVFPGQTNRKIHGLPNEDSVPGERGVRFDIRFSAIAPDGGGVIKLIINVEAQNKYYNSYPLITRGIYYLSRMISAQYGVEFDKSHYENIKKVYSIWVCTDPPKSRVNTMTRYRIAEEPVIGDAREDPRHYDLMNAVLLCLGSTSEESRGVFKLLETLLTDEKSKVQKDRIVEDEFGITMSDSLERKVNSMCNLSQGIIERTATRTWDKAWSEATETADKRHKAETDMLMCNTIISVMKSLSVDFDTAAGIMKISDDKLETYRGLVAGLQK